MRGVDGCLHLASAVGVQLVVDNPLESLLNNVRGTDIVMSAAARHGSRLLFTIDVRGVREELRRARSRRTSDRILGSPFKARWAYAIAKGFGESLAHALHREHGADVRHRAPVQYGRTAPDGAATGWCSRASSSRRSQART